MTDDDHELDVENMGSQTLFFQKVHKLVLKRLNPRAVLAGSDDYLYDESNYFELDEGENWLRLSRKESRHSILDDTQDFPEDTSWFASILSLSSVGDAVEVSTSCFLCLDVDGNCVAIKDMRTLITDDDLPIGIARTNNHWQHLPRRQLRILRPGDRICTTFQDESPAGLILEYQYSCPSQAKSESQKSSLDLLTQPMDDEDETQSEPPPESIVQIVETQDYDSDATAEMTQSQVPIAAQASLGLSTQPIEDDNDKNKESKNPENVRPPNPQIAVFVRQKEVSQTIPSPILEGQEAMSQEEILKAHAFKTKTPTPSDRKNGMTGDEDVDDRVTASTLKSNYGHETPRSVNLISCQKSDDSRQDLEFNPVEKPMSPQLSEERQRSRTESIPIADKPALEKIEKVHTHVDPNVYMNDDSPKDPSKECNDEASTPNPKQENLIVNICEHLTHRKENLQTSESKAKMVDSSVVQNHHDVVLPTDHGSPHTKSKCEQPKKKDNDSSPSDDGFPVPSQDISTSMLRETGEETLLDGLNALVDSDNESEITDVDIQPHVRETMLGPISIPTRLHESGKTAHTDDDSEITEGDVEPFVSQMQGRKSRASIEVNKTSVYVMNEDDSEITEVEMKPSSHGIKESKRKEGMGHSSQAQEVAESPCSDNQNHNPTTDLDMRSDVKSIEPNAPKPIEEKEDIVIELDGQAQKQAGSENYNPITDLDTESFGRETKQNEQEEGRELDGRPQKPAGSAGDENYKPFTTLDERSDLQGFESVVHKTKEKQQEVIEVDGQAQNPAESVGDDNHPPSTHLDMSSDLHGTEPIPYETRETKQEEMIELEGQARIRAESTGHENQQLGTELNSGNNVQGSNKPKMVIELGLEDMKNAKVGGHEGISNVGTETVSQGGESKRIYDALSPEDSAQNYVKETNDGENEDASIFKEFFPDEVEAKKRKDVEAEGKWKDQGNKINDLGVENCVGKTDTLQRQDAAEFAIRGNNAYMGNKNEIPSIDMEEESQQASYKERQQRIETDSKVVEPKQNKRKMRTQAYNKAVEAMAHDKLEVKERYRKRRHLAGCELEPDKKCSTELKGTSNENTKLGMEGFGETKVHVSPALGEHANKDDSGSKPGQKKIRSVDVLQTSVTDPSSNPSISRSTRKRARGITPRSESNLPLFEQPNRDDSDSKSGQKKRRATRTLDMDLLSSTSPPSTNALISRSTRKRARGTPPVSYSDDKFSVRVMGTNVEIDNKGRKMIQQIGGVFIEKIEDAATATHVIAASDEVKLKRTPKFMVAVSRTSNIVHLDWLVESAKRGEVLDTKEFLLLDQKEAESQYNFILSETLERGDKMRVNGTLLLRGINVFVCTGVAGSASKGNKTPPENEFRLILEGAGAKVLTALPARIDAVTKTIIITSKDPKEQKIQLSKKNVANATKQGAVPKTTDEIFHAIMTQEFKI